MTGGPENSPKILFIIPPQYPFPGIPAKPFHPHLGVSYLISALKSRGIDARVIDMQLGHKLKEVVALTEQYRPSLVGVTSYSYQYKKAYDVIDRVKEQTNVKLVIGGPHVSANRKKVLEQTKADFAIKGEGEMTLPELIGAVNGDRPYEDIAGLIWRKQGEIVEEADRPFIAQVDALPIPAFEDFELDRYVFAMEKRMPLITSRGCPYQCIFCSARLGMGVKFRGRSPENVVGEIEHWYHKGWTNYDFHDDCFSLDLNRAKRICDLIIARNLKITYRLYNGIRVDRVDKELLQKMAASGCHRVSFGVESGNQRVLDTIKKGITLEQVEAAHRMAQEAGIDTMTNFIIGHPGETWKEAMESIRLAKKLPTQSFIFYNLVPYPGTELANWVEKNGTYRFAPEQFLDEVEGHVLEPNFETKEFPAHMRRKALRIANRAYRKKDLQYRLGSPMGLFVYYLSCIGPLWIWLQWLTAGTKVGRRLLNTVKRNR